MNSPETGFQPEVAGMPQKQAETQPQTESFDEAAHQARVDALMAANVTEAEVAFAQARQLSQELKGSPKIEAVPHMSNVAASEGQQKYAMARAEQDISGLWNELASETDVSVADLKMVEQKYDRIPLSAKESMGLPEHFDQILTTTGKKPATSGFGKFMQMFTGYGKRKELFDLASQLVAQMNPEALANPEGGAAVIKAAEAKKTESKIDRGGQGGLV